MAAIYRTSDVERLLGLGEHVLRYWEKELPILSPNRSPFRRREWTDADISLLLRIRHLIRDRGYGLKKTLDVLIAERSGNNAEASAVLAEARAMLVSLYFESKAATEHLTKEAKNAGITCQ